eukprot:6815025-Prymnesium_polylepis.2
MRACEGGLANHRAMKYCGPIPRVCLVHLEARVGVVVGLAPPFTFVAWPEHWSPCIVCNRQSTARGGHGEKHPAQH